MINVSDVISDEAIRNFKVTKRLVETADKLKPELLQAVRDKAPVQKNPYGDPRIIPGKFKASLSARRHTVSRGVHITIQSPSSYARYIRDGSKAHTVYPVTKRMLMFYTSKGPTFALMANIPAIPPNNFAHKVASDRMEMLKMRFAQALSKL